MNFQIKAKLAWQHLALAFYPMTTLYACIAGMVLVNVNYILVYNEAANRTNKDAQLQKKQAMAVSASPSLDKIGKATAKWANKEYICFGLEAFKHYCFKEVNTFTQAEFEDYLAKIVVAGS